MESVNQNHYQIRRARIIKEKEKNIRSFLRNDFENVPNAEKEAVQMLLDCDLDYQKSKNELQILEQQKEKKPKQIEDIRNSLRKKEDSYLEEIENLKKLKTHNPKNADKKIEELLRKINTTRMKKYLYKEEYTKEVLREFIEILDDYKKAITQSKQCSFEECPSYVEFIKSVISRSDIETFSKLEGSKNGFVYNIVERVNSFIEQCTDEKIIFDITTRMTEMANQYDFREKAYTLKHDNTMMLLNAKRDGICDIYMEQTPSRESDTGKTIDGVTDFFAENSMQIFGAHFKPDEPEARISWLKTCPKIPKEIDKIFSFAKSKISLHLGVPMEKITPSQKKEFEQLVETISYLDGNIYDPEKESELLKLEELRALKNDKKSIGTYQILKVKFLLGAGLDRYRSYYVKERNQEENERNSQHGGTNPLSVKKLMSLGKLAQYSSYEESKKEIIRLQKQMKKEDKEPSIN